MAEKGRRRFGSDTQARFAASAKRRCLLRIAVANIYVTAAAMLANGVSICTSSFARYGSASFLRKT